MAQIISSHGMSEVVSYLDANLIIVSDGLFLRHDAVVGMEASFVDDDARIKWCLHSPFL